MFGARDTGWLVALAETARAILATQLLGRARGSIRWIARREAEHA
jgi:hypothetical protein